MTGLDIWIRSRKSSFTSKWFKPVSVLWLLSTCRIECKLLSPHPPWKALNNLIFPPSKPPLLLLLSLLPRVPSIFKLRFFKHILLCCASVTLNKSFCLVMLYCSSLFCQANCSSFKNEHKCHLLRGLLALPGAVSAFSACYLYLLCYLLFCTIIMSMPVSLLRLHALQSRDCDALIFVSKAENGA